MDLEDRIKLLRIKGLELFGAGEYHKALEIYEELLRIDLSNSPSHSCVIGAIYLSAGYQIEALEKFDTVIRSNPDIAPPYRYAALIEELQGRDLEALVDYRVSHLMESNESALAGLTRIIERLKPIKETLLDYIEGIPSTRGYIKTIINDAVEYLMKLDIDLSRVLLIDSRYFASLRIKVGEKDVHVYPTIVYYEDFGEIFNHGETRKLKNEASGKLRVFPVNVYVEQRLKEVEREDIEIIEFEPILIYLPKSRRLPAGLGKN